VEPVTPAIADAIGLKNAEGALVTHLEPASPAARSGIETGDVITSVNAEAVKDSRDLAKKIAAIQPGTSARLTIFRYGQEKMITVTLGEVARAPSEPQAKEQRARSEKSVLGLTLAPARAVRGAGEHGVVVTEINPTSRAAENGLQSGDIILEVGRRAVNVPADVRKIVEEARAQSKRACFCTLKGATRPSSWVCRSSDRRECRPCLMNARNTASSA